MENEPTLSEVEIVQALYGLYCPNSDKINSEECSKTLQNLPKNEKTIAALVKFIMNENEDIYIRSNASSILIKCMEDANELVLAMIQTFSQTVKLSKDKEKEISSINEDYYCIFSDVIYDAIHESNQNYSMFLVNIMIKFLNCKNDQTKLLEMGTLLLHALLENMSASLLPHFNYLINGLKIALEKSKDSLQYNNEMSLGLCYQSLSCVTVLGQHISMASVMLRPLRDSLETMLDLLKFIAEYGTEDHFKEVAELLNILLKNKKFSGKNWVYVLKTCESIFQNYFYQDFARIRTLVIYGNFVGLRRSYFSTSKIFNSLLKNVINVICEQPKLKEEFQFELPTPTSVAADFLQFISEKFPREKFGAAFVSIISSSVKLCVMDEWKFRGVLISLGRVVKTCGEYMNANYSSELILVFKYGFINNSRNVRQASTYALEKFFTHFLEESTSWTKLVFSSFLMNFTILVNDLKADCLLNSLHVERVYTTLATFCDILKAELALYLPTLMNIYIDILDHIMQNRIIILTIEMLGKAVENAGVEFLNYFCSIIKTLGPYLTNWDESDFDEIRPKIIELLRKIAVCALYNKTEFVIKGVNDLVFNMLKIQHARTQFYGADLNFLLKYSPLRCSIFYFFREIPKLLHGTTHQYMQITFGTLLGTITAARFIDRQELYQPITYNQRPELLSTVENYYSDEKDLNFKMSDNNELETARFRMAEESHTLHNEIYQAVIVLKDFICPCTIERYADEIFSRFGQIFSYASHDIRKEMLYTLNIMMRAFLKDFQFVHSSFLDLWVVEIIDLINIEADFTIIGECVGSFLYYIAIKEKYIKPRIDVHIYLLGMMKEIFQIVNQLPQDDIHRMPKEFLLSKIISYMKDVADMCPPARFCNYFRLYLVIFEAKINMPLYRSPKCDKLRHQAYAQLIFGFRLVKNFKLDCFYKISILLMKGLTDPIVKIRRSAAAGLCLISIHCCPEEIVLHKWILKVLWQRSRREKSTSVLENIWYNIVAIITTNIWRLPMQKLSERTIRLLPVRDEFDYNRTMLTFFETIYIQRPEYTLRVVKDIYKYLVEILKKSSETDLDPIYQRALTLAASLYNAHVEELRNISISPFIMQSITTFCKLFQRSILP